jgi:hypothetical protein
MKIERVKTGGRKYYKLLDREQGESQGDDRKRILIPV